MSVHRLVNPSLSLQHTCEVAHIPRNTCLVSSQCKNGFFVNLGGVIHIRQPGRKDLAVPQYAEFKAWQLNDAQLGKKMAGAFLHRPLFAYKRTFIIQKDHGKLN